MWTGLLVSIYWKGVIVVAALAASGFIFDMVKSPKERAQLPLRWAKLALFAMLFWPWLGVVLLLALGVLTFSIAAHVAKVLLIAWALKS